MSDIVSPLLEWLNAHPQLAGLVTFLISAGESVAILGTIVPGSIMMTALGTLAGAGVIPLWETIIWAILGAIVGDGISYWIGYYFKDRLPNLWPFRTHPNLLKTGEAFVHKYGGMSVFIGRFVGPVRALVPLVAGMLGMKPLHFTIANVTSAIGWAPAYMLPGILLGAASLELPPDIAVHVILVLLLITLFILLCLWFIYKLLKLIHNQTTQLQNKIWQQLKTSRHLATATILLKHHNPTKTHGQLTLAIYFLIISLLFLGLACYVKFTGPHTIMVNDALFHLFRGIKTEKADNIMLMITLLGQKEVILPIIATLFVWLLIQKQPRVAFHVLALGILVAGSIFVIKKIFHSPRPWGIFQNPETFSMPSGHTTLATAIYLGIALLLASSTRPSRRWIFYTIAFMIAFAVGVSRLYLGAHWFTDILSAWLLSAAILIFVIISYHRQRVETPLKRSGIIFISIATLIISFSLFYFQKAPQLRLAYSQLNWPIAQVTMNEWWQKKNVLPSYHTSLFGFPSQQINIEWTGHLEQIRESLLKEGWAKPPSRDLVSTLHRVADISSAQYLPLVSPQYLDKKPALIMTRQANNGKSLLVIRLWDANRTIKETHSTVWVGVAGVIPRSYSWLFKKNPGDITIHPAFIFPNKTGTGEWQWKIMPVNIATGTKETIMQNIMLIRPNKSIHTKK